MSSGSAGSLAARIAGLQPKARRLLVAIAGPPASGKSTLAEELVDHLGSQAALVPMDGFHMDNAVLKARGLLPWKGAPETFDVTGFVHSIRRLAVEEEVVIPVFDRTRDLSVAGAAVVSTQTQIAVVEGNYLLLDAPVWRYLHDIWDFTVFLDVPEAVLKERLIQRWLDHGHSATDAEARAQANDLPNAQAVLRMSIGADVTL